MTRGLARGGARCPARAPPPAPRRRSRSCSRPESCPMFVSNQFPAAQRVLWWLRLSAALSYILDSAFILHAFSAERTQERRTQQLVAKETHRVKLDASAPMACAPRLCVRGSYSRVHMMQSACQGIACQLSTTWSSTTSASIHSVCTFWRVAKFVQLRTCTAPWSSSTFRSSGPSWHSS